MGEEVGSPAGDFLYCFEVGSELAAFVCINYLKLELTSTNRKMGKKSSAARLNVLMSSAAGLLLSSLPSGFVCSSPPRS